MYRISIILLLAGLAMSVEGGQKKFQGAKVNELGMLTWGNVEMSVSHWAKDWSRTSFSPISFKVEDLRYDAWQLLLRGKWQVKGGKFDFVQRVVTQAPGQLNYRINLHATPSIITNRLRVIFSFPVDKYAGKTFTIDSKEIALPQTYNENDATKSYNIKQSLTLSLSDGGVLEFYGPLRVERGYRKFGKIDVFTLEFDFNPVQGELYDSMVSLNIRITGLE